ncbi:MAG: TA system VapC family ribonuclease toxin [Bryobacteraceae bacterium]
MKKATSDLLLLDVHVLLAMAWPNHQFHAQAVRRLEAARCRWATCALTQLAFIRLSSNPAVVTRAQRPSDAAALLRIFVEDSRHIYLKDLPSPIASNFGGALERLLGHQQLTDAYLLALAGHHHATFVTFDARMKHLISPGAGLEILSQPS